MSEYTDFAIDESESLGSYSYAPAWEDYESDPEIDPELQQLSNLTKRQLNDLIQENLAEIANSETCTTQMQFELDLLERENCDAKRTAEELQHIQYKRRQVREYEIILEKLKERLRLLKQVKPKYQTFNVRTLPQVILCDKWPPGALMPKIVVCQKASKTRSEMPRRDDKAIRTDLTAQQLELIEKEKRCIELECGQLQLQIAGVKGQARVISNENNKLKAIIGSDALSAKKYPCRKKKGPRNVLCPAYKKPSVAVLEIDIASAPYDAAECDVSEEDLREELHHIENKVGKLEAELAKAKLREGTMIAQREALRCVKEALK